MIIYKFQRYKIKLLVQTISVNFTGIAGFDSVRGRRKNVFVKSCAYIWVSSEESGLDSITVLEKTVFRKRKHIFFLNLLVYCCLINTAIFVRF